MNATEEEWKKNTPEYFLQKEVLKKLEKTATQESRLDELRLTVEKNLNIYKKKFEQNHPKNKRIKNKTQEQEITNYEEQLHQKFLNSNFKKYILGRGKLEKCLIPDIETTEGFLNREYSATQKHYKVSKTLDFFTVFIGLDGFKDGVKLRFNLENKKKVSTSSISNTNAYIETLITDFITNSKIDVVDLINFSNKVHKKNLQEQNDNEAHEFMEVVFNDIINNNELSQSVLVSIEFLFEHESRWWQRAVLASVLTLSILKFWDVEKVKLLKRLAEIENEPLVSERAIIGITLALIKSNSDKNNFLKTVRVLSPLKNNEKFSAGIYETLDFFYETKNTLKLEKSKYENVYGNFHQEYDFNYFEPPHREAKYISQKLFFNSREEEDSFFSMINTSFLNSQLKEKSCVIFSESANEEEKDVFFNLSELLPSIEKDYLRNKEFLKKYPHQFYKFLMENVLKELIFHFSFAERFKPYLSSLDSLISNTKKISIYTDIFNHFPYHRYLTTIPITKVLDKALKNDSKIYFDIGYLISLKEIDDVAVKFIKKGQKLDKIEDSVAKKLLPLCKNIEAMQNL